MKDKEPPFPETDAIRTILFGIEKKIRELANERCDILGVKKDKRVRDKLYEVDIELFKNQLLYSQVYFDDIHKKLESVIGESLKKEIFRAVKEKNK